ncbi:MAG: molecular chaperone HtpG, partial [Myxococcota bacterium]
MMSNQNDATVHQFEAEVSQVLSLVINSLYSNKEIFLRELISNASDALDKVRFRAITEPDLLGDDTELRIRLRPVEDAAALIIEDNGVGMTDAELRENLGTIAHSGSRSFLEQLRESMEHPGGDVRLIGQFGVGFYSAFLVADKVEVLTKAAGAQQAWRWTSDAQNTYTIAPDERAGRGTTITLHLKDDYKEFLDTWRLRGLISKYSDYVDHPIELFQTIPAEEEGAEPTADYKQVNEASALWSRSPEEIEDAAYDEFYKHLAGDWEPPLARTHFKIEGTQLFTSLLFTPRRAPFDLFDPEGKHGIRLYVKRVFIMEDCKDLLPRWLRFVRGVVDSDDLPLNVSRETLQDSRMIAVIRKQVVKKSLGMLEELAEDSPEDYLVFWEAFGSVLKEGLHFEPKHKNALAKLVRYESSAVEGWTSLAEYVERMPEDQPAIYYALGPSRKVLEGSPHLEVVRKKGWEVLYMVEPVDQFAVLGVSEFADKKLMSVTDEDLELDEEVSEEAEQERKEQAEGLAALTTRFTSVL